MLWSIDSCQKRVSADQYHMTVSLALIGKYSPFNSNELKYDILAAIDKVSGIL